MKDFKSTCRIAVIQGAPIMFDKNACTEKAVKLIHECAENGAELIVFPELFIPGYPYGLTYGFTVGSRTAPGREDWMQYHNNSILEDGDEMQLVIDAAMATGTYVSIGYSERDPINGTLYNSNMMIAPDGTAMNHRKLKPTGTERVVWGDANCDYFPIMDTPWGPMANLICWESYMPLARVALYEEGVSLYISPNTNDNAEWHNTIRHIAIEGHCYFINCDMYFTRDMYPKDLNCQDEIAKLNEVVCRGGSCVIDPFGHEASDVVWDKEAIIYADLDMSRVQASRMEFDACGHYSRPDVLELIVKDEVDWDLDF